MKKIIICVTTTLLAVFALSAIAVKPQPEPSVVTLSAGPFDVWPSCRVSNNTDQAIEVNMALCYATKDNKAIPPELGAIGYFRHYCFAIGPNIGTEFEAPHPDVIEPGHFGKFGTFKLFTELSYSCKISYPGEPGDITGSACIGSNGCVPMQ